MPLLLITLERNKPDNDYAKFVRRMDKYSNIRLSEFSYAIITDKPPKTVCKEFKKFIKRNDSLFVITLKRPYFSSGAALTDDWLKKTLTY
jgi:hypothetical protein